MRVLLVVPLLLLSSCDGRVPRADERPDVDADEGRADFLSVLSSRADVALLANENGFVDFFLQVTGAPITAPIFEACEFIDASRFPTHLDFLQAQPGGEDLTFTSYQDSAIRRASRVWWSGSIRFDEAQIHPVTGEAGTFIWVLYNDGDITLDDVRAAHAVLLPCTSSFAEQLATAPTGSNSLAILRDGEAELLEAGIATLVE